MEGHLKLRLVFLSYLFVAKKFIKVLYAIKTWLSNIAVYGLNIKRF